MQRKITNHSRRKFIKNSLAIAGSLSVLGFGAQGFAKTLKSPKEQTMNLTKKAQQTFETLFGKVDIAQVPLAKTDPEFFSNYANFAFDDVLQHSDLNLQERLLIILASLVAIPALGEYQTILGAALKNNVSPVMIKEVVYQAIPYVGMGKVIDFINATNEAFVANNIALPLQPQATTNRQNRKDKGLATQRALFGEAIDKGNAAAPADVKHIREFLSANCFGDYYTRTGLDLKFRELLTFVYILSMGGADAQVRAHVAGNLRIGNDRARLVSVVTALVPYIGYPRSLNALGAIDELAPYS